jgi:hypothetical protein
MSNRTADMATTLFERPLPIAGLAVPDRRALGLTAWGETDARAYAYEVGLFSGAADGPGLDGGADLSGRVFVRPLASLGRGVLFELAQLGVSARVGLRKDEAGRADLPSIATGRGFVLWQPGRVEPSGRALHVVPDGAQRELGGELRLPIRTPTQAVFDLRAEAYYVNEHTLERPGGTATPVRLGELEGIGWYASLTWWACFVPGFDQLVTGEPGVVRPVSLDDARAPALASGWDASILAGGIHGKYDPATRGGAPAPGDAIDVYQFAVSTSYRLGTNVRAGIEYDAYFAPDSGESAITSVVVPDDLTPAGGGHVQHELGIRVAGGF